MATKNDENWLANYEALKAHVLEHRHFPNKHDKRLNWYKYNAKLIKQGKLSLEREQMIHELEEMRSGGHTGGRLRTKTMRYRYDNDDLCFEEDLMPPKRVFDTSECAE